MPHAEHDGISLYYETQGDPGSPALLMIEGWNAQIVSWPDELCDELATAGMFVVRHDNRDAGLSTFTGEPGDRDGGYTLADMAADSAAVMTHLGIERFHVVGASMGGMIAQRLLTRHAERVHSATLLFTTARPDRDLDLGARPELLADASRSLTERWQEEVAARNICRSTAYPPDPGQYEAIATALQHRQPRTDGSARQLTAIQRSPSVLAELAHVDVPTSVVHGFEDVAVSVRGAWELACALPNADLHVYSGWNHEFPPGLRSTLARIILDTSRRASPSDAGPAAP